MMTNATTNNDNPTPFPSTITIPYFSSALLPPKRIFSSKISDVTIQQDNVKSILQDIQDILDEFGTKKHKRLTKTQTPTSCTGTRGGTRGGTRRRRNAMNMIGSTHTQEFVLRQSIQPPRLGGSACTCTCSPSMVSSPPMIWIDWIHLEHLEWMGRRFRDIRFSSWTTSSPSCNVSSSTSSSTSSTTSSSSSSPETEPPSSYTCSSSSSERERERETMSFQPYHWNRRNMVDTT